MQTPDTCVLLEELRIVEAQLRSARAVQQLQDVTTEILASLSDDPELAVRVETHAASCADICEWIAKCERDIDELKKRLT
jgi:hypothetical protein